MGKICIKNMGVQHSFEKMKPQLFRKVTPFSVPNLQTKKLNRLGYYSSIM